MKEQQIDFNSAVEVEVQALEIKTALTNIAIATQQDYNNVVQHRVEAAAFLKRADEFFDGPIKNAHELHKQLLGNKKKVTEPVETSMRAANQLLLAWDQAQETLRRAEQVKLEQAARAKAEAERIQEAEFLQAAGGSTEAIEDLLNEPVTVTEMVAAPRTYEVSKAITMRNNYSGEVTNLMSLIRYVAKNPQFVNLLQPNSTAINAQARALKESMSIPGVAVRNNKGVAGTGR